METLKHFLQKKFEKAIQKAFGDFLDLSDFSAEVVPCGQEDFGHYQCNDALKFAQKLKKKPREVAETILASFDKKDENGEEIFTSATVAGPGFINLAFSPYFLSQELDRVFRDLHLGGKVEEKKQKVIIDFSSPNIAKELHVGHLRSTIIGDCLARVFEFLGHEVVRLNHIGDWGTQFGMLIAYLKIHAPEVLRGEKRPELSQLMEWYKGAQKLFEEDEAFKGTAHREVVRLQRGDKTSLFAWQMICDISRRAFQEIYDLLDVSLIERGESFYNPYLQKIVEDLEAKGLITVSDGAKCIFLEGFYNREGKPLPVMVQKSDGSYNYDTTDIAAFCHRVKEEKADRIIIVTDAGQSLHFQMVHQLVIKAGYLDPNKVHFDHVPFGIVLGPDGKKFRTRKGETEKLIDLLYQAIHHARKLLLERLPSTREKELEDLSKILGVGALKYADLSSHRQKDYVFSYERMLRLEGNTAAFLLYAYVRIMGIKRKVQADMAKVLRESRIHLDHPSEVALGLHLRRFGEVLETVSRDLLPNRLCDYLYELAEKFNHFFRDCRVEGSEEQNERLLLCELSARILEQGLDLLGIKTLPRM